MAILLLVSYIILFDLLFYHYYNRFIRTFPCHLCGRRASSLPPLPSPFLLCISVPYRPVLVQRYGGFEVWNIKKLTSLENVVRYHVWEQERACALLATQVNTSHTCSWAMSRCTYTSYTGLLSIILYV